MSGLFMMIELIECPWHWLLQYLDIVKVSASYLEKPAMNHVNGFAAPLSNIAVRSFGTYVSSSSM